jgi:hypothetical protein
VALPSSSKRLRGTGSPVPAPPPDVPKSYIGIRALTTTEVGEPPSMLAVSTPLLLIDAELKPVEDVTVQIS